MTKSRTPNLARIKEGVIAEIKWLAKRGDPLNITAVKRSHPKLIEVVFDVRPFWGWKQAIEDAGLDYGSIKVELSETVECRVCGRRQLRLQHHIGSAHDLNSEAYLRLYPTASIHADKWQAETYPLTTNIPDFPHWEQVWTPEYLIDRIHHMDARGIPLHATAMLKAEPPLVTAAVRFFGSWDGALEEAGIEAESTRLRQATAPRNAEALIEFLKERSSEGKPLNYKAMQSDHPGVLCAIREVFGNYKEALKAAGFDLQTVCRRGAMVSAYPTKESIVAAIRKRHMAGQRLSASAVADEKDGDLPLHSRAVRLFGSWRGALVEAGVNPDEVSEWKYKLPGPVLEAIRERVQAGIPHGAKYVLEGEHADTTLYAASVRHFGGWVKALEAIGIAYRPPRRKAAYPTRDAVLAAIRKRHADGLPVAGVSVRLGDSSDWALYGAAEKLFGNWADAVHVALPLLPPLPRRKSRKAVGEEPSPEAVNLKEDAQSAKRIPEDRQGATPAQKEPGIPSAVKRPPPPPPQQAGNSPTTMEDLIRSMGLGD